MAIIFRDVVSIVVDQPQVEVTGDPVCVAAPSARTAESAYAQLSEIRCHS